VYNMFSINFISYLFKIIISFYLIVQLFVECLIENNYLMMMPCTTLTINYKKKHWLNIQNCSTWGPRLTHMKNVSKKPLLWLLLLLPHIRCTLYINNKKKYCHKTEYKKNSFYCSNLWQIIFKPIVIKYYAELRKTHNTLLIYLCILKLNNYYKL